MNGLINAELVRIASDELDRRTRYGAATGEGVRLARSTRNAQRRSTLRRLVRRSQEMR